MVYTRKHLAQSLAVFILGTLLGLLVVTMRLTNRLNSLVLENEDLHHRYKSTTLQLERLETLVDRQGVVINAIQVEVVLEDQFVKPRLEAIIQHGTTVLVEEEPFELECKLAWIPPKSLIQVRVVRQDGRRITH